MVRVMVMVELRASRVTSVNLNQYFLIIIIHQTTTVLVVLKESLVVINLQRIIVRLCSSPLLSSVMLFGIFQLILKDVLV